jgi:putative oxidoreductase
MNAMLVLRIAVAITLLAHSIPVMLNNGVNDFGNLYLNQIGFAPFGLVIAWSIKVSHVVCAVLFIINRYINLASFVTLFVLIAGIIMIHFKEGWFVVGLGRNGMEFNFLLICIIISIIVEERNHKRIAKGIA